ncbi:Rrf2 family transcriptional regulator [Oerskovia turbata]|uniref:Rrf2 family transcriptional regulator n=1 Tax=Oerskovia turbata TaxID=1713 RepID=A0A4Q1KT70_9CELL|nr:Rrf2 family transcriptional regulator [Oerskovia turbata]RXR25827.1 Rrf2 family transcriptional regulator [Oerskovia turbata]RXR33393.1 Rrf2 family transcriptional regulator [Oerskovia turbata]TGJ96152.1 Rrf2 family transcriptional regulator [Actinotalea fermentans ATCC 43279 = JCM 9966 = DSM 3133]
MQLTQFTDLGLRIVMRLSVVAPDEPASTRQVAEQMAVSYTHATKVVTRLAELGVVHARRGRTGGLTLTDAGRTVTVGWLVRRLEGDGEVVTCEGPAPCPLRTACRLRHLLRDAQEAFYRSLDDHTVASLAEPPTGPVLLTLTRPAQDPPALAGPHYIQDGSS